MWVFTHIALIHDTEAHDQSEAELGGVSQSEAVTCAGLCDI